MMLESSNPAVHQLATWLTYDQNIDYASEYSLYSDQTLPLLKELVMDPTFQNAMHTIVDWGQFDNFD
jgi:hypothetical protein